MKKQLLALAVAAGIAAVPATASAEAVLYGSIYASVDYVRVKGQNGNYYKGFKFAQGGSSGQYVPIDAPYVKDGKVYQDIRSVNFGDGPVTKFGLKGSEDLYDGAMKAIYQIELGIPMSNTQGDTVKLRNTYVGLSGDFGTFLAGRYDSPIKIAAGDFDLFGDDFGVKDPLGYHEVRYNNTLAYISPDLQGFQLMAATVVGNARNGNNEFDPKANKFSEGWSAAIKYEQGPFKAFGGYEHVGKQMAGFDTDTTLIDGKIVSLVSVDPKKLDVWTVGMGVFNWEGFTILGSYEEQRYKFQDGEKQKARMYQGQIGYQIGNTMFKGTYGEMRVKGDNLKARHWAVGVDQHLSERTVANITYADYSTKHSRIGNWNGVSVGIRHAF